MNTGVRAVLVGMILGLWAVSSLAVIETYEFSDPALEARYHALSEELRCPKCQNQNIADSNAPISQDLRRLLYEQLEAGASDEEIRDYMVARYGEFVLYRPRFSGINVLLWLAPLLLLGAGGAVLFLVLRSRGAASRRATGMNEDERARVRELLREGEDGA